MLNPEKRIKSQRRAALRMFHVCGHTMHDYARETDASEASIADFARWASERGRTDDLTIAARVVEFLHEQFDAQFKAAKEDCDRRKQRAKPVVYLTKDGASRRDRKRKQRQ